MSTYIVEDSTNKSQAKGPGKVIVFPVRHEVATVSKGTENDERHCTECAWKKKKLRIYLSYTILYASSFIDQYYVVRPRTTDAQRGNSLHYTVENSLPLPNF